MLQFNIKIGLIDPVVPKPNPGKSDTENGNLDVKMNITRYWQDVILVFEEDCEGNGEPEHNLTNLIPDAFHDEYLFQ